MGALVIELGKKKPEDETSDEHEAVYKMAEALGIKRANVDPEAFAEAYEEWRACCEMEDEDE